MAPRHAKTTTSQNPPTAPNPSLSNDKSTPAQSVIHHNSKDRRTSSSQLPFGSSSNRYRTSLRPLEYIAEGSPTVEGGFSFSRGREIVSNERVSVQISGRGWFIGTIVTITRFVKKCTGSDATVRYLGQSDGRSERQ